MIPLSLEAEKKLLVLRQQHGQLFYTEIPIGDKRYKAIFRPMTLAETKAVSNTGSAIAVLDLNDTICKWCILHSEPTIDGTVPAAIPDIMAQEIMDVSGFDSQENFVNILNEQRELATTVEAGVEIFICRAFPGITPKDVRNMSLYEQMEMLARAEIALGTKLELGKTDGKGRRRLSPETASILSKEVADKPDPMRDNAALDEFLTGRERLGVE